MNAPDDAKIHALLDALAQEGPVNRLLFDVIAALLVERGDLAAQRDALLRWPVLAIDIAKLNTQAQEKGWPVRAYLGEHNGSWCIRAEAVATNVRRNHDG